MSQSFLSQVKVEKSIPSVFNALSNFENIALMIDKTGMNCQFIPFFTVEDKVYFCTTVMGKKGVVSMKRCEKDFNKAVHHNAEELVGKVIERQFDKFISNISNPKMVSYSVSTMTGQLVKVIPLYQDEKPIVEINS